MKVLPHQRTMTRLSVLRAPIISPAICQEASLAGHGGTLLPSDDPHRVQITAACAATGSYGFIFSAAVPANFAILLTDQELDKLRPEISFAEAHDGEKLRRLDYEKKRFLDGIKVFVYNLKAQMCRMLFSHYYRQKEILPALSMIVERAGYLKLEEVAH